MLGHRHQRGRTRCRAEQRRQAAGAVRREVSGATGRLSGTTLGLVKLGVSRASEHYLYRHHSDRGKQYEDFFCLTPIGVRVGYGSPKLLKILTTKQRKALRDRVVWASTSNPFYSIDGVRRG